MRARVCMLSETSIEERRVIWRYASSELGSVPLRRMKDAKLTVRENN